MKLFMISAMAILTVISFSAASAEVKIPDRPARYGDERVIAIAVFKKNRDGKTIVNKHPALRIREVYTHAINGYSLEGPRKEMEALRMEADIEQVSECNVYEAEINESVPFIGGGKARGYFSSKNERLTGRGVRVGIIDTGIDYHHLALKASFKGGYDFVDKDADPKEAGGRQPTIHGTHVAGIIAADGRMKGMAPEAEIYVYRVLGPGGSGNTELVLKAIDKAIEDKMDILNLSLGNSVNGPDLPINMALDRAVELGITAVASSGNSGPGMWTVGSPGTSSRAISTGASTPPLKVPYLLAGLGQSKKEYPVAALMGSKSWPALSASAAYGGIGRPGELRHVRGKAAIIKRGGLSFTEKVRNAEKAGAAAVLIYNNTRGQFLGKLEKAAGIPAASISREAADAVLRSSYIKTIMKTEKDRVAEFSSRGPVTVNWQIKPDIVAPGVDIHSTVPGGYLSLNGTSMAAPHVTGACAILKQAHPDWGPDTIKSALMSTARILGDGRRTYHTYEQGAGRIQLEQALKADTFLYPSSISLEIKKAARRSRVWIEAENTSKTEKHYRFSLPKREEGVYWKLPLAFTLKEGEKKRLPIELSLDRNKMKPGVHDGYLTIHENANILSLPYLYAVKEPDYPRLAGFQFVPADSEGAYRYELYLPGGADEMGIALYEKQSLRFAGFLDWAQNAHRGLVRKQIKEENVPPPGSYKAVIFARKGKKEDRLETEIKILENTYKQK
ncbi:S8 family serine peptidase [Peribacillus kribbensis]|uniref:S8 family serine peptidase n=1 Tax=Peribacillus kribbensis TaxID=356658 RepID=UPI0003FAFAC3|nr:S8 family serine peptidase [Peribacillus kribbensis]